jgi:hypothetical protein
VSHIPEMHEFRGGRVAIGWLLPAHDFVQGVAPPEFVAKLKRLAATWGDSTLALGWGACGGVHTCEFCGHALGAGRLGVPAGDRLFYAPDMIAHYVEAHAYLPPAEFVAAVLACPIPGTKAYATAVARFANPPAD